MGDTGASQETVTNPTILPWSQREAKALRRNRSGRCMLLTLDRYALTLTQAHWSNFSLPQ